MMERWLSSRVGFGLVAALYLLSFPYHPGLRSPNELARLWMSRAIVDHHTLALNETMREFGPVGDLSCAAVFEVQGQRVRAPCLQPPPGGVAVERWYYSSKAPLMSFLGVPVYWGLKALHGPVTELAQVYFSRLFLTVLPTLLLLWMLRQVLATQVPAVADLLVVVYALGTIAFSYAEAFMSHQLTAVLLFGTFFAGWKVQRGEWGRWGWLVAGAAGGAAVSAEYTAALTVLCLAVWVVAARWKQWGRVAEAAGLVVAGAAPFLVALMAYHASAYGHPLESGYRWLNDAGYQHWHVGGFLGIHTPDPQWLVLSLFSPLRGLFALSPFLLVVFWGLDGLKAKDFSLFVFVVVLLGANAYFTSSFDYTSWGWTVGPRHLTPMVPFLLLPVGLALQRFLAGAGRRWLSAAGGLMASSVLATGLVVFVNYVPDNVSTSVFGLAVPLLRDGVLPVSWLPAIGVANPLSGAVLVVLLLGAVAWVVGRVIALRARPVVLVVVMALHLGALRLATKYDGNDEGAQRFLKGVWLAPPGATFSFFGTETK